MEKKLGVAAFLRVLTVSAENGQVKRQKNERQKKKLFVPSVGVLKLKLKLKKREGRGQPKTIKTGSSNFSVPLLKLKNMRYLQPQGSFI